MSEPEGTTGQAKADSAGATATAPQGTGGQSATPSQTTTTGPDTGNAESFFDPKTIEGKPELQAAYKQMQAAFTKKSQKFKDGQRKIEAYDSFMRDPKGTLEQLARQHGISLVQGAPEESKGPQSWDDVYSRAKQEVMKDLEPYFGEIQQLKQQNVEQYLDGRHPDWRTYEDDMLGLLQDHPSLARDPDKLYRLAVPDEVWETRATKAAMAKLNGSRESGQISGASATTQKSEPTTDGIKSFNDAVAYAKAKLEREGRRLS